MVCVALLTVALAAALSTDTCCGPSHVIMRLLHNTCAALFLIVGLRNGLLSAEARNRNWQQSTLSGSILVSAQTSTPGYDLYLDDQQSGDYPVDDDDFNSGSGSGAGEVSEETVKITAKAALPPPKAIPTQDSTKELTPRVETFTSKESPRKPVRTECTAANNQSSTPAKCLSQPPVPATDDPRSRSKGTSTTSSPRSAVEPFEVRSENLFQRTEVLAAVIAGGVIGFLFAIFLILLLVYRMRKKDEGSYDLGERKPSGTAYQKAPTKEFYA
ncbi:syndecan-2-A-like [Scleropages formosus]|uniref:Syndecan n=1 Tax=Scleropages formosus TaxID=113540 RepID=A0A0P7VCN6_SCLFO|nr:syndecan-2-A-like [Scleropages formosus]